MSVIDQLLQGSIDLHIHAGPDPNRERRGDALELAQDAERAGQRAIVLKSHDYPTAPLAHMVQKQVAHLQVFGSLCLDAETGGLSPLTAETSAKLGAKIVWMPTFSAMHDRAGSPKEPGEGITILDEHGVLVPVVGQILEVIRHYDMVLATGHLSFEEAMALLAEARRMGLTKLIATHPLPQRGMGATLHQQQALADHGALVEHCFNAMLPLGERIAPDVVAQAIRFVGVERCLMSTDLGQGYNPLPSEGMRMYLAAMQRVGFSQDEIEIMVKRNPASLLGPDLGS